MLAASAMVRGSHTRHSASPRTISATSRLSRPTCASAPSTYAADGAADVEGGGGQGARGERSMAMVSCDWEPARASIRPLAYAQQPCRILPPCPPVHPEILGLPPPPEAWYRGVGRDLPWRRTRDPYEVLVSEFMLQQTQVARVTEYYPRFLSRYPTVQHLAGRGAGPGAGSLGGARATTGGRRTCTGWRRWWCGSRTGRSREEPEALRRLPGVGRYTAGAVATFAFEQAHPAVDTNVAPGDPPRLPPAGARVAGERSASGRPAGASSARAGNAAWTFNQAIMELGALVCTARVARCGECPVAGVCRTGRRGRGRREATLAVSR